MSSATEQSPRVFTMAELLVHALVIELEAVQSYRDLTSQMEECGNAEVAALFAKMAVLEQQHANKIREQADDIKLPELAPWEYRWAGFESPESIDASGVHYLMKPHQALSLALENELNAMAFFDDIAKSDNDPRIRALANEFAADEREHVAWMKEWLAKYPRPDDDWDHDPDPPNVID